MSDPAFPSSPAPRSESPSSWASTSSERWSSSFADAAFERVAAVLHPAIVGSGRSVGVVDPVADSIMTDLREEAAMLRGRLADVEQETAPYRTFAVDIARYLATPGTEDAAEKTTAADLPTLLDCVRAEYGNGRAAGDAARFERCKVDIARVLGFDDRRVPEWGDLVSRVRELAGLGASIIKAQARAIEHERAGTCLWLRSGRAAAEWAMSYGGTEWTTAADAIERGAHSTDDPLPSALAAAREEGRQAGIAEERERVEAEEAQDGAVGHITGFALGDIASRVAVGLPALDMGGAIVDADTIDRGDAAKEPK